MKLLSHITLFFLASMTSAEELCYQEFDDIDDCCVLELSYLAASSCSKCILDAIPMEEDKSSCDVIEHKLRNDVESCDCMSYCTNEIEEWLGCFIEAEKMKCEANGNFGGTSNGEEDSAVELK